MNWCQEVVHKHTCIYIPINLRTYRRGENNLPSSSMWEVKIDTSSTIQQIKMSMWSYAKRLNNACHKEKYIWKWRNSYIQCIHTV